MLLSRPAAAPVVAVGRSFLKGRGARLPAVAGDVALSGVEGHLLFTVDCGLSTIDDRPSTIDRGPWTANDRCHPERSGLTDTDHNKSDVRN